MSLIILFICGIANFAMHRAMMESDAPLMVEARTGFQRIMGPYGSYIIEFAMLLLAMILANMGMTWAVTAYVFYAGANIVGAYFLLNGKM